MENNAYKMLPGKLSGNNLFLDQGIGGRII